MKVIWLKNKVAIIMVCYIVFIAVSVKWVFLPAINRIREGSDEIQRKNLDGEINRRKIVKIHDMERGVEVFKKNEDKTDVFVESDQEVDFIEKLEGLAEETKNQVTFKVNEQLSGNSSQAEAKKVGSQDENGEKSILDSLSYKKFFYLQISLKGDNQSIVDFIRGLENFKKYSNIVSLNLNLVEENPDGSPMTSNIFSYSLPSGNQSGGGADVKSIKKISAIIDLVVYTK